MTKKKNEHVENEEMTPQDEWGAGILANDHVMLAVAMPPPEPVSRLYESGIIEIDSNNDITWRPGHLEHIANLFAGDPAKTERDYADDLAVARAYSADAWEALTK